MCYTCWINSVGTLWVWHLTVITKVFSFTPFLISDVSMPDATNSSLFLTISSTSQASPPNLSSGVSFLSFSSITSIMVLFNLKKSILLFQVSINLSKASLILKILLYRPVDDQNYQKAALLSTVGGVSGSGMTAFSSTIDLSLSSGKWFDPTLLITLMSPRRLTSLHSLKPMLKKNRKKSS